MRKYETIVVLDPTLGDAEIKDETQRLQGILEARGAKSTTVESWGKKEIAYTVHRHRMGHFLCFRFETDGSDTVHDITDLLRITERVIKFQTHRIHEKQRKFQGNPKKIAKNAAEADEFAIGDSDF